jgi:putative oxidoreductase
MTALFVTGRVIFGGFFIINGLNLLMSHAMMAQLAASKGVPAADVAVVVAGALILFGGASIVLGWRPELGIAAIAVFLVCVTFPMHDFWAESGAERTADLVNFMKNMALLGATLMFAAVPRPWPISVTTSSRRPPVPLS